MYALILYLFDCSQVNYSEDEGNAHLSWYPVDVSGDNPPQYKALMYEEKKLSSTWSESKEVYLGYETSCTVSGDLFSPGLTYSFGVSASAQGETGKESESEFFLFFFLLLHVSLITLLL